MLGGLGLVVFISGPVKSLVFRYLENLKRGFFMESLRPFISFASGCIRAQRVWPLMRPFAGKLVQEGSVEFTLD